MNSILESQRRKHGLNIASILSYLDGNGVNLSGFMAAHEGNGLNAGLVGLQKGYGLNFGLLYTKREGAGVSFGLINECNEGGYFRYFPIMNIDFGDLFKKENKTSVESGLESLL